MRIKKMLCAFLAVALMCASLPVAAYAAEFSTSDIAGSWFGQGTGYYQTGGKRVSVERYIDFTVDKCDSEGNFSGSGKFTTVEGQGYDYQWFTYDFTGKADFDTASFHMEGTKITASDGKVNWHMPSFNGTIRRNTNGEVSVSGIMYNSELCPFSVSHTSTWAKNEMTQANILGLIPDTLKDADMTRRITRAEFAAVAVKLYESLTGKEAQGQPTPFTDIAGNANQSDIEKAYHLGIVKGTSDDTFSPADNISREQLATMLCRAMKKYSIAGWSIKTDSNYPLDISGVAIFADDADISGYARESVYYMAKMKIINGMDSTHFAPRSVTSEQKAIGYATATREQAVALSLRIYNLYQ